MWESLKNYIAAFGKWGLLMAAILVGDVLGIIQSYYTEWLIPTWGWWLILVIILIVSPFIAFHKLRVQRDELQAKLQNDKDTPKLPSPPELNLDYLSSKFGIENDVRIITVSAWYRTTAGKMRISHVKLHLIGESIPPLDWRIIEVSQELWYGPDTKFELPIGISSGEHDAELFAFANEKWWGPYTFTVSVPEVKH